MHISLFRVYLGRNLYSAQPCVHLHLSGLTALRATDLGTGFEQQLTDLLNSLQSARSGTRGAPACPPREGTTLGTTVAWIAGTLLYMTGMRACFRRAFDAPDGDTIELVLGYREAETSVEAVRHALSLLVFALPAARRPAGLVPRDYTPQRALEAFFAGARRRALDQTGLALIRVAERRDIPWFRMTQYSRTLQLGHGRFQRRFMETVTASTSSIAEHLSRNKSATVDLLRKLCIPVPRHYPVSSPEQAERIVERLGFPVVIKPNGQGKGAGITVRVDSPQALRVALNKAAAYRSGVVIEEYIPGADFRALVVNGTLIAVARRIPAQLIGDGSRSINDLVESSNRDPRRGVGFDRLLVRLSLDQETDQLLAEQGCTRQSVPAAGTRVFLRRTANISTGGTAEDMTGAVHPDNRRMLERAARAIDLDICGVDFITTDIGRSYREVGGAICEINRSPGLRPHLIANPGQDVAGAIMDYILPPGEPGRMPVVAVTGSSGKTTTCKLLASILHVTGHRVGLATSEGVSIDGECIAAGAGAAAMSAQAILRDPAADAAVLETAGRDLLSHGISFDSCDVGVVLNVGDDQIGIDSNEALASCARLVAESARDTVVLNADDDHCVAMRGHLEALRLCLVTTSSKNPLVADHMACGGLAALIDPAGSAAGFRLVDKGEIVFRLHVADLSADLDPPAVSDLVEAAFAGATAYALGKPAGAIRAGLAAFWQKPE